MQISVRGSPIDKTTLFKYFHSFSLPIMEMEFLVGKKAAKKSTTKKMLLNFMNRKFFFCFVSSFVNCR